MSGKAVENGTNVGMCLHATIDVSYCLYATFLHTGYYCVGIQF
jgi:hypothetical protein